MNTKPYSEKLNRNTFSIGLAQKVPERGANLAYVSSPKINLDNVNIINSFNGVTKTNKEFNYSLYYPDDTYRLHEVNGSPIRNQNMSVTDEFTIKKQSTDEPFPLFFKSILSKPIRAITQTKNIINQSIPYVYGYESRTEEQLKSDYKHVQSNDLTPFTRVITITNKIGQEITEGFKIRLKLIDVDDTDIDKYEVIVYHNFDSEDIYRVSYREYNGSTRTEILKSERIFERLFDKSELQGVDLMDKVYAVKENGLEFEAYAPSHMYKITDGDREPYEFRYRLLGKTDALYSKDNPTTVGIGVISFSSGNSNSAIDPDLDSIVSDFINSGVFPNYINFANPHPDAKFTMRTDDILNDPDYWKINLTSPQHFINDYDLIIITGYGGPHDLSSFNKMFSIYLQQGGKILIDNSSNHNALALRLNFKSLDPDKAMYPPIIDYTYVTKTVDILEIGTSAKEFNGNSKYVDRYYDLNKSNPGDIAHINTDRTKVGPLYTINQSEDRWKDILTYASGSKSIGYLEYLHNGQKRGSVYFSNSGILRGLSRASGDESKHFVANLVISIVEDKWTSTPWITDRMYSSDQLFEDEIKTLGYSYTISSLNNKPVMQKTISPKIEDLFHYLTRYKNVKSSKSSLSYNTIEPHEYYIETEEFVPNKLDNRNEWSTPKSLFMPKKLRPHEALCVYPIAFNKGNLNVSKISGFDKSDIKVTSEDVHFKFTIRPFVYEWSDHAIEFFSEDLLQNLKLNHPIDKNEMYVSIKVIPLEGPISFLTVADYKVNLDTNSIELMMPIAPLNRLEITYKTINVVSNKKYGSGEHTTTINTKVSKQDGYLNLGKLANLLPRIPSGETWGNRSNVFYEVKLGYFMNGTFMNGDHRVNLLIYDKLIGRYLYTNGGENIISHDDLFANRYVITANSVPLRIRNADDIIIQAFTNFYTVTANKRIFAIKQENNSESDIFLPPSLNSNECWHPRIKYMNFVKNTFDKEDYERIAHTLKFKFEKDYILGRLKEYHGEEIHDNVILDLMSKLNNDKILDERDWEVAAEAFDLIDNAALYEYDMHEYYNQAWHPYSPVKRAKDEIAEYINEKTIKVQYKNLVIDNDRVVREGLELISSEIYLKDEQVFRSINKNWLASESIVIEFEDTYSPTGWSIMNPNNYKIDFNKGIVVCDDLVDGILFATYSYSNLEVYKKIYYNLTSTLEELQQLDTTFYDIPNIKRHSRVLVNPTPVVYWSDTFKELEDALRNSETDPTILHQYIAPVKEIDYDRGYVVLDTPSTKRVFMTYWYEDIRALDVKDIDVSQGVLELTEPVHYNDNIYITYHYNDKYYEYKGYREGNQFIYLDLNPTRGHECTLEVPSGDDVIYKNVPSYEMVGETVYFYLLPKRVLSLKSENNKHLSKINDKLFQAEHKNWKTSNGVRIFQEREDDTIIEITDGYEIDEKLGRVLFDSPKNGRILASYQHYITIKENEVTIRHTIDKEKLRLIQFANPEMIVLGSVKISNDYSPVDAIVLDTRRRGGGLKESVSLDKIKDIDTLSLHFWDIASFDGPKYFSNGVTIIDIPKEVLETFTESEVEVIVKKHIAFGVHPIIQYY